MVELVSRQSVFDKLPKIGNKIYLLQKSIYNDSLNDYSESFTESDLLNFDFLNSNYKTSIKSKTKRIKSSVLKKNGNPKYFKNIANQLNNLLSETNTVNYFILAHLKIDFFSAMKIYYNIKRFRKTYSKLEEKLKVATYNEAIKISNNELIVFLEILNKIDSFGGGIPEYILICDENDTFCLCFHYSGEITFWSFEENEFLSDKILNKHNFQRV